MKSFALLLVAALAVGSFALPTGKIIVRPDPSRDIEGELKAYREWVKNAPKEEDFLDILNVPTGFAASMMCSGLFLDNMDYEEVLEFDVDIAGLVTEIEIDYDEKSVTARMLNTGDNELKSIYREGVGCTLIFPEAITEAELRAQYLGDLSPLPSLNASEAWPLGDYVDWTAPEGVDMETLQAIVDEDFANTRSNTRAVIVVYQGKIVLEQYKDGMDQNTKFLGWSMTKSVNAALTGILVGEGRWSLDERIPVPEWEDPADEHYNITLRNMLNMAAGINWLEGLNIPQGLYMESGDCAAYAASRPVREPPNTVFEYSTGVSTLIARGVHHVRPDTGLTNFEYPRAALFSKIAMNSATIEPHLPTYHLGGSNMHATARDWARFGLLNMRYGEWVDGTRILPEGWVDFTCAPSPAYGGYGAQWWVGNNPEPGTCRMSGFRSQSVYTMKQKGVMIVRLSMPKFLWTGEHSGGEFNSAIYNCFP